MSCQVERDLAEIEVRSAELGTASEEALQQYQQLRGRILHQEKIILSYMVLPDKCLHFLRPGRLIRVREGKTEWGWGVVVSVARR